MMRRDVDVRVAFCEQNSPNLRDVLAAAGRHAVVVPLLLADAYHARVDIPAMIRQSGSTLPTGRRARRGRPAHCGASTTPDARRSVPARPRRGRPRHSGGLLTPTSQCAHHIGRRLSRPAHEVDSHHRLRHRAAPDAGRGCSILRERGATRLVIAPWFLAHGRITDRIAEYARAQRILMAAPLGPHRLVADTVLDRFDQAVAERSAA